MISEENPCTETRELLHAFVEGEVDSIRGRRIEDHVAGCAACADARREIEEERLWLMDVLVKGPPLSPRFAEKVTRRIQGRARFESARKRSAWALRGAAAVALFSVALVLANRSPSSPEAPSIAEAPRAPEAEEIEPRLAMQHEARPDRQSNGMKHVEGFWIDDSSLSPLRPNAGGRYAIVQHPTQMWEIIVQIAPGKWGVPRDPCAPDPNRDGKTDEKDVAYTANVMYAGMPPVAPEEDLARAAAPGEERMPGEPDCDELCLRA